MFFRSTNHYRHQGNARQLPLAVYLTLTILLLTACGSPEPTPTPIPPAATNTTAPTFTPEPVSTPTTEVAATPIVQADSPLAQPESPLATQPESPLAAQPISPLAAPPLKIAAEAPSHSAFVSGGILYLQNGPSEADLLPIEDCSAGNCFIYHLTWSPTGDHLLYYYGSYEAEIPQQIRLTDNTGAKQTLTEKAAYAQPAGWSPDGQAIVYRTDTDRFTVATDGPAMRFQEVWTVTLADDGTLGEPELRGEVTFGEGCGGGGRSESANVYEREGGFAYGYLAGITLWTPEGILLYSDNCTTRGVSRFDLANGVALDPYTGDLRSLSLNGAGDAWVAINGDNQIVIGTPSSLEFTTVPSDATPELVFYGTETGTLYYTILEVTGSTDLIEQVSTTLDPSIMVFPYFDTTVASLVALDAESGDESELYGDDAYAYARVSERNDGSIIFSSVEGNTELQAAVENNLLTAENWRDYLPTADVLTIPSGGEVSLLLANAEQYTPAPE